jgi:LysR family hydrogen peroxide-inducible transcriptional activator
MTLQEFRFIVILAREKHFGKASAACFVTQPTLSIAVQKLEKELGIVIFERNKNDVRVTVQGERIVEQARRVLDEVDKLKIVAQTDQDQLKGVFKLGAIYTAAAYMLPFVIKELSKTAPDMPLEIREDFTENLRLKLRNGEVDAIVVSLPFKEPGIITKVLYREPFAVLMPENHPLAKYETIDEKLISNHQMLLIGQKHCFRDQVISSCPDCFSPLNSGPDKNWRSVEGTSLETLRHMVASGMGITVLPMTAAITNLCPYGEQFLTVRPLKSLSEGRTIALAWRKSFPRMKALEAIIQAIYQCDIPGATMEKNLLKTI